MIQLPTTSQSYLCILYFVLRNKPLKKDAVSPSPQPHHHTSKLQPPVTPPPSPSSPPRPLAPPEGTSYLHNHLTTCIYLRAWTATYFLATPLPSKLSRSLIWQRPACNYRRQVRRDAEWNADEGGIGGRDGGILKEHEGIQRKEQTTALLGQTALCDWYYCRCVLQNQMSKRRNL